MDIRTSRFTMENITAFATNPPGFGGGKGQPSRTYKERRMSHGGTPYEVPTVPARQLKAVLRRGMAEEIIEREGPMDFVEYTRLSVGGVKGSDKAGKAELEEAREFLRRHPEIDLFGGGEVGIGRFVPSKVSIEPAYLDEADLGLLFKAEGVRSHVRDAELELLSEDGLKSAEIYIDANRARAKADAEVKSLKRELRKAQDAVKTGQGQQSAVDELNEQLSAADARLEQAKAVASAAGSDNAIGMPLPPTEYVGAGGRWSSRLSARGISKEQAGLLIRSLQRWADGILNDEGCRLGAYRSQGRGVFSGQMTLEVRDGGFRSVWKDAGRVSFSPAGVEIDGTEIGDWVASWDAWQRPDEKLVTSDT